MDRWTGGQILGALGEDPENKVENVAAQGNEEEQV